MFEWMKRRSSARDDGPDCYNCQRQIRRGPVTRFVVGDDASVCFCHRCRSYARVLVPFAMQAHRDGFEDHTDTPTPGPR